MNTHISYQDIINTPVLLLFALHGYTSVLIPLTQYVLKLACLRIGVTGNGRLSELRKIGRRDDDGTPKGLREQLNLRVICDIATHVHESSTHIHTTRPGGVELSESPGHLLPGMESGVFGWTAEGTLGDKMSSMATTPGRYVGRTRRSREEGNHVQSS